MLAGARRRPRVGLCSVTLRNLGPRAVIDAARATGLESIEWGSDVHVRPGDLAAARAIGSETREAGLAVASYGSYVGFPWVSGDLEDAVTVIATAHALGAPRIRVWAGPVGSAEADPEARAATVRALSGIAERAEEASLEVAVEFHLGTLADTASSALQLMREIARPNVSVYWQPTVGASDEHALSDLLDLRDHVSTCHVFSWDASFRRFPISSREAMWRSAITEAVSIPSVTDLLLEFLPGDDAALLMEEVRTLRRYRSDAGEADS